MNMQLIDIYKKKISDVIREMEKNLDTMERQGEEVFLMMYKE